MAITMNVRLEDAYVLQNALYNTYDSWLSLKSCDKIVEFYDKRDIDVDIAEVRTEWKEFRTTDFMSVFNIMFRKEAEILETVEERVDYLNTMFYCYQIDLHHVLWRLRKR